MDNEMTDVNPVEGEDTPETPSSSVEPKTPEVESEPTDESESTEEVKPEGKETKTESKKSAESRIRELNSKAKQAEEKAQSLSAKLEELTRGVTPQGPMAPYVPQAQPGQEITPEQYKADIENSAMQKADALVQLRINQQRIVDRINSEANKSMKDHPELDPDNDNFDKELSDSVTLATEAFIRANPTESVTKFVDRMMKPYKKSLVKEVAKEAETITKQVSQAALRPTTTSSSEKSYEDMTPEELENKIGATW